MKYENQNNRFTAHLSALKRFNKWEETHPSKYSKGKALESIGLLYEWLPKKSRQRSQNVNGIQAMRRSLAKLNNRI